MRNVLETIVLCVCMQGGNVLEHTELASVMCFRFSMQEEDFLEHTDVKWNLHVF